MAVLERVPVARIEREASEVDFGRLLLTVLVGVFWVLGFVAGKVVLFVGVVLATVWAALKTGWADSRPAPVSR